MLNKTRWHTSSVFGPVSIGMALAMSSGCVTKPVRNTVYFQPSFVRSAANSINWGFRHPERMSPFVDDQLIVQGNGYDGVSAFDRETGNRKWFLKVPEGTESGTVPFENNVLFGGSDGYFYSVNKANGKVNWTFPTRTENLAAPTVEGGVVYFLAGNNVLYALDARTGKQLWSYNREEVTNITIRGGSSPTIYKNMAYVGFSDGQIVALNTKDGTVSWERKLTNNPKFIDVDSTPVVSDSLIWVSSFDGSLYALSRTDGQIQWKLDEGGATAVTIDQDRLYFGSTNQVVYCLNKDSGQVYWKYQMHDGVPTQPVLANSIVFVGSSDSDLLALDSRSGELVGSFRPGAGVFAKPVVDPKRHELFVFSNGGNLYVLKYAISDRFVNPF